ncbi:MAG: flagellar filament capping protein FliD, partial [Synergistaceae bacterium]|nr:flagellar filament capping protein FliD [Synergistaceae bacterium]
SIISESKGNTVFGVLHGDQLLSSIKNQLRTRLSNPISTLSNSLSTRKFLDTANSMNIKGSFYIYVGGKATRIDVSPDDSLADVQKKIQNASNIVASNGSTAIGDSLGLTATIRNGQLVIDGTKAVSSSSASSNYLDSISSTIMRSASERYDYLSFVPVTASPVSGTRQVYSGSTVYTEGIDYKVVTESTDDVLKTKTSASVRSSFEYENLSFVPESGPPANGILNVTSGSTTYQEGVDYEIVTETTDAGTAYSRIKWLAGGASPAAGDNYTLKYTYTETGVMSSRIEWLAGKGPQGSQYYNVNYTYYANAISVSPIQNSGPTSNEVGKGISDLSFLDLHQDTSKLSMSNLGITTESTDYGKSGYLEFDSDAFLAQMESDPNISSNAMLAFMRDMDTYIGNLVDSSQTLVAGQIVTKGRIAGALNTIDTEQATLYERITQLESQLEEKQTALYKRYSDMEVAIQKLNAQMSSISNFLNSQSSSS